MTETIGIDRVADPLPAPGAFRAFLREFLVRNYFYVISAGLMILGCFLLMRSTPVAGGEFSRVFSSLALLQGYELLVLGTIALIRRRLPTVEDALTLVGVEAILLLDPTFFTNNLLTLVQSDRATGDGLWVTIGCLLLIPAKVGLIERLNNLRLAGGTWCFIMLAATIVYMAPWALATTDPLLGRTGTFYAIVWLLAIAIVVPPRTLGIVSRGLDQIQSDLHRRWLPRFFVHFPLIVMMIHLGETFYVHKVDFQGALLAPVFLAIGCRLLFRPAATTRLFARVIAMDVFTIVACVVSLPAFRHTPLEVFNREEFFFTGLLPIVVAGLVAAGAYIIVACREHKLWILLRPAAMVLGGVAYYAWTAGLLADLLAWVLALAQRFANVFMEWNFAISFSGWIAIAGALLWTRKPEWIVFLALWTAPTLLAFDAVNLFEQFYEIILAGLAIIYIGALVYAPERDGKAWVELAFWMTVIGLGRMVWIGEPWYLLIIGAMVGLFAVGYLLSGNRSIGILTGTNLAAAMAWYFRFELMNIPPAAMVIAVALVLFGLGIAVSFRKERLLAWVERR